jgi:catechol 2,3-dioxygenase-like lactoylglutathione lyase family enzyme
MDESDQGLVALVVRDYDEAIDFFVNRLGLCLDRGHDNRDSE